MLPAKTGSANEPTLLLGSRSRKRPNCLDISHLGPMHGPNNPQGRNFHQKLVRLIAHRLTTRRLGDRLTVGENRGLKSLFARL
jgi:hypothetical protein